MRKVICTVAGFALILGALTAPALAKKKKPKPVAMTFFLHGGLPIGEAEVNETWANDNWMGMSSEEPGAGQPKSIQVTNYLGGPNTACAGNGLLPVWVGGLTGKVVGDMKLTLNTAAIPDSQLTAVIYPDPSAGCDEESSPAGTQAVVVPAGGQGTTEVTFSDVQFDVVGRFIVQLHITTLTPGQVRVFYDSADAASQLTFSCIPATGNSCEPD